MHSMNEMMMGAGRLTREGHQISWGPGRHTAGDNTFCYFKSPSGFSMEYTAEVQRINETNWKPNVYEFGPNVTDYWGISRMGGGGPPVPPPPDPGLWKAPPI
jgi:2,3-dihydroxy-p-cumate/2,3-dihydroxybenzoate 3,4-dioxygenase